MVKLAIGDEVAITVTVRRRVTDELVSVSIPTYGFPHAIYYTEKVKRGQQIEIVRPITRIDEGTVTIDMGVPVTVKPGSVKLVTKYQPPKRKKPLVDVPD
jgi:hypothetical protein